VAFVELHVGKVESVPEFDDKMEHALAQSSYNPKQDKRNKGAGLTMHLYRSIAGEN
jgi:hypothetical protein